MPRQAKNYVLISLACAMLITILIQSACQKEDYISREDFINKLKGEWYVSYCSAYPIGLSVYLIEDSVKYSINDYEPKTYSVNDPILCTLAEIEHIQYWTITENNDDLNLETQDLCGGTVNYTIDYNNYHYMMSGGYYRGRTDRILADIKLVSQDTTATLLDFYYDINYNGNSSFILFFGLIEGDCQWNFTLYSR